VHSGTGDYNALIVDGSEFRDVRGSPPYYIDIPDQKRIVFATGTWGPSNPGVIHVFDFRNNRYWQFKTTWGQGSSFGEGVNEKTKGERNSVEKSTDDEMVLIDESLSLGTLRKIVLDLESKRIKHVEWFLYDDKGKLTNSYIKRGNP
jgi:hypothetical protein